MFDKKITDLFSASLFGTKLSFDAGDYGTVFEHMKQQAVAVLPAGLLGELPLSEELRAQWKKYIYRQIFHFQTLARAEQELLNAMDAAGICVLVLKGTSAARYYPIPQYRTMGDIDLLIKPADHQQAANVLTQIGFIENTNDLQAYVGRHRAFQRGEAHVELHSYFAKAGTPSQNELLNKRLFIDMVPHRHIPTEIVNGLVLIEHIAQHLETGIGLRQMVDWMMYVNAVLDDDMWEHSFREAAKETGVEMLAVTVTRMCQLYLGLPKAITWSNVANDNVAHELMTYVMNSGNFGIKREKLMSGSLTRIPTITKPATFLRYLQKEGRTSWTAAHKHKFLTPFCWLYQLIHYVYVAKMNHINMKKATEMRQERKKRKKLFEELGVSQNNK